jgi:hypothetical protein
VSTVKKSHARMLAAWPRMNSRQETPALLPGSEPASRSSLRTVVADVEPERGELARDPLIAPAGIFAREAEDELAGLSADRRSPGLACRIGPASRDELAVPAQDRARGDEERAPAPARNAPARSGEERPIGPPECRPRALAPEDRELVTKHDDLELLELLGAAGKRDKLMQSLQSDVEQ